MRCILVLLSVMLLAACGQQSPDERLNQRLDALQQGMESRSSDKIMALLHPDFLANREHDHDWARRTMALMFLQNQRINVLVLNQSTEIDPLYSGQARTRAQVTLSGAERFIPDTTRHYQISLDWLEDDGDWYLHRLSWE